MSGSVEVSLIGEGQRGNLHWERQKNNLYSMVLSHDMLSHCMDYSPELRPSVNSSI